MIIVKFIKLKVTKDLKIWCNLIKSDKRLNNANSKHTEKGDARCKNKWK